MSDLDSTDRWQMPLLAVNQMQKDVTHNEALAIIDHLLQAVVETGPQNSPPVAPLPGTLWLAGPVPTGVWSGHADELAGWSNAGWRWFKPMSGMAVRARDGRQFRFTGSGWEGPAAIGEPSGGAVVDSEARAVLSALIQALQAQGIVVATS